MIKYTLSILSKIVLFLFASYMIFYSYIIIHCEISSYYYSKLYSLNKSHELSEKEVMKTLLLFFDENIQVSESPYSFMINLKKGEYLVRYSFMYMPSIEIIYNYKGHIVTLLDVSS